MCNFVQVCAIDVFRKRSSVSAFRCASLCYYLYLLETGIDCRKEIPEHHPIVEQAIYRCTKLYLYLADYILTALLERWGNTFEQLNAKREEGRSTSKEPTLYDELSNEFSRDQLNALLKIRERTTPARVFLCQWSKRGLITPIGDDHYMKIKNQKS